MKCACDACQVCLPTCPSACPICRNVHATFQELLDDFREIRRWEFTKICRFLQGFFI